MTVDTAYELAVTPTVQEVARRLWARTKGKGGQTLGTFTADTRPTDVEAEEFITGSVDEVTSSCPTLPESRWGLGKEAVVIRTCMKIELSYRPEQANDSESAYYLLRQEWLDLIGGGPGGQQGSLCRAGGADAVYRVDTVRTLGIAAGADVELAALVNGAEP